MEAMERTKYEEGGGGGMVRHTSVVNSATSVLRSTHQEAGKSQLSPGMYEDTSARRTPGMYEDANARRTPVNYSTGAAMPRGSPMLGRAQEGCISSGKPAHDRKSTLTPTHRQDNVPAKSPVSSGDPMASHSPFDPHHRPVGPGEVYRAHLPPHLDPATLAFHRVIDPAAAAYMFPRQPSPTGYHNTYQLYTMENTRQTILNDYITSQQMQVIPRPDVARGLSPREQQQQQQMAAIPYPPGARGHQAHLAATAATMEREREHREREKEREKEREREHREREREREHREHRERERERAVAAANEYMRGGAEQPGRPGSRGYLRSPSPSVRTPEGVVQQRPSIFQGTNSKSVITSLMPPAAAAAAAAAAAQAGSRYNTAADALAALVDAAASAPQMDVAKAKEDDGMSSSSSSSARREQQQQEAERRSMQSPYGGAAMSLPGGKPPPAAPHPGYAGEGAGLNKDKGPPTKSRIEEELRTRGKTTITAANFIDVIITRQIASDKDARDRGSQSSDSSGSLMSSRYEAPGGGGGGGAIEVISPASSPAQPQQDKQDDSSVSHRVLDSHAGMRAFDMSRYRQPPPGEPPQPSPQQQQQPPPSSSSSSSQAESPYSQVPKTHRVMTLADHISHIITQDFARNQDAPPSSIQPGGTTFQSAVLPGSGRAKGPSRYSPENQNQNQAPQHHQRPPSRVSPENGPDSKPRARPGKSPERGGGRPLESYEPISPPQSYPGMDKQEPSAAQPQRREADIPEMRGDSRSPGSVSYLPSFFTKLENTSPMVKSKKQEIFRKLTSSGDSDVGNAQPGTEIFNLPAVTTSSSINPRNQSFSDPASNLGLEDIIRKALMGNLEERPDDHHQAGGPSNNTPGNEARQEANPSPSMGKQKLQGKSNSRKSKSPNPGQAYAGGERPSSVSSVHSEGDYHRQPPAWGAWGEDRPSSTGSMQFPYNPLTMRMLSSTPPAPMASPSMQAQQPPPGGAPGPAQQQQRVWEREPLLSEQYETLSDSDD